MEKEINENIIEIEGKKYKFIEAEKSICCKNCDLRKDEKCHLLYRMCISDNRKDKKEGYFKIVEETTFDLQNYTPKGDLIGFPKEIISRMLDCQEEQGNKRNVTVFEKWIEASRFNDGFAWDKTKEDREFWDDVIRFKNFNRFFEKHPKQDNPQDNPQEFRVGDNVIDIIRRERGKVLQISINGNSNFPIQVSFNEGKNYYTLDGRHFTRDKYPRLLHYRDDYDYSIIDFNNLPKSKRQEPKRWRAEKGGEYHTVRFDAEDWVFTCAPKDANSSIDNVNYNSGNYFRTEVEAEIIAQKLNTYFKQLIQEGHEHKRD